MPDFPKLPIITPPPKSFPDLPIVTPDPPRLSLSEKYGGLFYLGLAGLAFLLLLLGQFAYGLWASRDLWGSIWVLHDPARSEPDVIRAAWKITRHPTVNDVLRTEFAFRKTLPSMARYVIAEGLTPEAIRADPKAYALMVAKSDDWPDWLRLLMVRPMAYGVGEGYRIAWEPVDQLRQHHDPAIALWATYTRAVMPPGDAPAALSLQQSASQDGLFRPLAVLLEAASKAQDDVRNRKLDEATVWLRTHHPEASQLWKGWTERDGQLVQSTDSK